MLESLEVNGECGECE